ncbi:unnamed protein product [Caenorhabditis bovis]|uniref:non-specific serine/threonine protein kinase n=1 Tax=Caenorhabditis bovis TaxID=2654633 RepID=A0A8S1F292_9PELO|nr:unnamed protein product [Caenorhabditis bovis]
MTTSQEPKPLHTGQVVDGKWRIKQLLGKGACGVVYKVEDKTRKGYCAAMKVEYVSPDYDQTLRLEIGVLNKLRNHKHMMQLIDFGKRKTFTYMVTTLCGKDLMALRCKIKRGFNDSSALRIAVFTLFGLKQVHEAGYVHRDVKPGNIITAANKGRESRTLLLIDFGMARSFVTTDAHGKKQLRPMRRRIPLRGTIRYCSLNVHERYEQGRSDDLIAMMYMLVEVTLGVPWHALKDEKEIITMKKATKDSELFEELPEEFRTIFEYLKPLTYPDRPNYMKIYNLLINAIKRLKVNFLDPYEWEDEEIERDLKQEKEKELEKEKEKEKNEFKDHKDHKDHKDDKEKEKSRITSELPAEAVKKDKKMNSQETEKANSAENAKSPTTKALDVTHSNTTASVDTTAQVSKTSDLKTIKTESKTAISPESVRDGDKDLETAIDYQSTEYLTKKALPRDELQYHVYPAIGPKTFEETIIPF